jgi:hypothetical protein
MLEQKYSRPPKSTLELKKMKYGKRMLLMKQKNF